MCGGGARWGVERSRPRGIGNNHGPWQGRRRLCSQPDPRTAGMGQVGRVHAGAAGPFHRSGEGFIAMMRSIKEVTGWPGAVLVLALLHGVGGCAAKRPVLYASQPNDTAAQRDIDECIGLARESGADSSRVGEVVGNTAGGAAVGGATGAVAGGVYGDAGRAAGAGAAVGATGGFFRGLFQWRKPDPVFRGYVDRCLRERDHEPIGWR